MFPPKRAACPVQTSNSKLLLGSTWRFLPPAQFKNGYKSGPMEHKRHKQIQTNDPDGVDYAVQQKLPEGETAEGIHREHSHDKGKYQRVCDQVFAGAHPTLSEDAFVGIVDGHDAAVAKGGNGAHDGTADAHPYLWLWNYHHGHAGKLHG